MAFDIPREECGGGRGGGREDDRPGVMQDLRAGAGDLDSEVPRSPDVIPSTRWGIVLPANEGGEVGMPMGVWCRCPWLLNPLQALLLLQAEALLSWENLKNHDMMVNMELMMRDPSQVGESHEQLTFILDG